VNYQIEIREVEPVRVAFMKYKGFAPAANKVFSNVFKAIRGKTNGAPFFAYYSMNPETQTGEMELCVPTEENPVGNGIEEKTSSYQSRMCYSYWAIRNAFSCLCCD
jgi:hypothetical protein